MATNASRMFFAKWSDKGKVAYGVSKLRPKSTVKSNIIICVIPAIAPRIYIYKYIYRTHEQTKPISKFMPNK